MPGDGSRPGTRTLATQCEGQRGGGSARSRTPAIGLAGFDQTQKQHACGISFSYINSKFNRNFHREGNRQSLRAADKIDLVSGALTNDDLIGTNGVGTTLRLNRGVIVDLNEHYCEGFLDFANSSALVVDPITVETLAVIDLVLYRRRVTPELTALVHSVSSAIELRILEQASVLHQTLRERFASRIADHISPSLAIDRNGAVIAEHRAAAQALGMEGKLRGRLVSSIPELRDVPKGAGLLKA